jgi:Thiol-disulfide isomerase and thioredoxins
MAQQIPTDITALLEEKDPIVLKEKLSTLGNSGNEEDLMLLSNYYRMKGQQGKYDSIQNIALTLYPKGQITAQRLLNQLMRETNLVKKESLLAQYQKDFLGADQDAAYGAMVYTLVKEKGTCREGLKYFDMIKNKDQRLVYAFHAGVNVAARAPKLAEPFLKRELEEFGYIENETGDSMKQKKGMLYEMKFAYGKILADKGQYQQALPFLKPAFENTSARDMDKRLVYARVLVKLGNYQEAFPILDQLVKDGKGNAEIKQELTLAYSKVNPGKDGSAYIAGIEREVNAQIAKDYLRHLMNKPAPKFTLTDVNGKDVSLSDFKGKIIIVDFWATWCGPCKASFPAMQLAVNKYKNDPDVKFLFVHTWETSKTPLKDAKAYLDTNHYTFDLYIDPKNETGKSNKAAEMFGVKGIPQKFIIDGKGNIRFNVGGFGGGDDAAVEELSNMIEYLKNN